MFTVKQIDKLAFIGTVVSAAGSAVASGNGWTRTAVATGCIAALIPIINRWTSSHLIFAPRVLSTRQATALKAAFRNGPSFSLWLNHNREEGESAAFHAQLTAALQGAGLVVNYYGGLTNATTGIEISGPDVPEKRQLITAFKAARIKFTNVYYADAPASEHSPLNTVGISVSIGRRF